PVADCLRRTGEHAVTRTLVEGLLRCRNVAPQPLVIGIELQRTQEIVETVAAADFRGPFVVNAGENLRSVRQEYGCEGQIRLQAVIAMPIDILMPFVACDRGERPVLVGERSADGVAERAVGAAKSADVAGNGAARIWEIAAAAARRGAVALEL